MHRHKPLNETVCSGKQQGGKDTSMLQVSTTAFSISHFMSSPLDKPFPPTGQMQSWNKISQSPSNWKLKSVGLQTGLWEHINSNISSLLQTHKGTCGEKDKPIFTTKKMDQSDNRIQCYIAWYKNHYHSVSRSKPLMFFQWRFAKTI